MSTISYLTVEAAVRASDGLFMSLVEKALSEHVAKMSDAEYSDTFHPPLQLQKSQLRAAA